MGTASLDGRIFRVDPSDVNWEFHSKVREWKTVGGKVVQIFGTSFGDMTVQGSFGIGTVFEQYAFLKAMKDAADNMVVNANVRNRGAEPMRFVFPAKQWDFRVYLKGYTEIGQSRAVHHANSNIAPTWQLIFFVVQGSSDLKKVAEDAFIKRLANGLGWKWNQSSFNGPTGQEELRAILNGGTIEDAIVQGYGIGQQVPSGNTNQDGSVSSGSPVIPTAGSIAKPDLVALLRSVGFSGEGLRIAFAVAMAESGGRADAINSNDNGSTDRGLFQINSVHIGSISIQEMFDPTANAEYAFSLSQGGTDWDPWVTYKKKTAQYRRYYAEGI